MQVPHVVFPAPGRVELDARPVAAPGAGEVLVRADCTLVNTGDELAVFEGRYPRGSPWDRSTAFPFAAGRFYAGRVAETGPQVEGLAEGDLVVTHGPHAAAVLKPAWAVVKLPQGIAAEEGIFALPAQAALHAVRLSRIALGERAAVVGMGLMGQLACRMLRLAGAWPLIAIDEAAARLELARGTVHHVIQASAAAARDEVARLTGHEMVDAVFDATGSAAALEGAIGLVRPQGRAVVLGTPTETAHIDITGSLMDTGIQLIPAHEKGHPRVETPDNRWTRLRHTTLFLAFLAARQVSVLELVTHRFPWQQAAEAYGMLRQDRSRAVGVILNWDGE